MLRRIPALFVCGVLCGNALAGTIEDIRARGVVNCGVEDKRPGISERGADGKRSGLAIDFCGALAGAVLGRGEAMAYVTVTGADAYAALQAEEVDVLLLPMAWTFSSEVEQGVLLVQPMASNDAAKTVLGPIVRQGDDGWFAAVRWVLLALMQADSGTASSSAIEAGRDFGLSANWIADALAAAGNFSAMAERNAAGLKTEGFTPAPALSGPSW